MNHRVETISHAGILPATYYLTLYLSPNSLREKFLRTQGFERCTPDSKLIMVKIDPNEISHRLSSCIPTKKSTGMVGSAYGPWDKLKYDFENHHVYQSFEKVFLNDGRWKNTYEYDRLSRKKNKKIAEIRGDEYKDLYHIIKNSGYMSQTELHKKLSGPIEDFQVRLGSLSLPDEVRIAVDRYGKLLHVQCGKHRLALAKIANYNEKIPAIIQFKHENINIYDRFDDIEILTTSHPLVNTV